MNAGSHKLHIHVFAYRPRVRIIAPARSRMTMHMLYSSAGSHQFLSEKRYALILVRQHPLFHSRENILEKCIDSMRSSTHLVRQPSASNLFLCPPIIPLFKSFPADTSCFSYSNGYFLSNMIKLVKLVMRRSMILQCSVARLQCALRKL
jgi:hypothetical protein